MSDTPTFLIEKASFDKAYKEIANRVKDYFYKRNTFWEWKAKTKQNKQRDYEEMVKECGSIPDGKKINEKVEKEVVETDEYKKQTKELIIEDSLSQVLEYYDSEEYYEIKENKYYIINPELTSETKALREFLNENGVLYAN